ncbi:MAG: hypothetical protein ACRDYB_00045 [Acidimicrobiales bacterium]
MGQGDGLVGVVGSSVGAARKPGRAGGVEGAGEAGRNTRSVEGGESHPGGGKGSTGFGGSPMETADGVVTGPLAKHDQHLSAQQVPALGQLSEEAGVTPGCCLQGGVRQTRRGVK